MKHTLLHLLGCLLPLLVIFLLPLFGVDSGISLLLFIVLMFGCHLFMMRGHGHSDDSGNSSHGGNTRAQH